MNIKRFVLFVFLSIAVVWSSLSAADFTVSSFNCGGLSDHYDYIRAVCMHKLTQERYNEEPEVMSALDKIQRVALKILFSQDPVERELAEREWEEKDYATVFSTITAHPEEIGSVNALWREKSEEIVTDYRWRPVRIHDEEVREMLESHINDITRGNGGLDMTRRVMAERIFHHQLKYDIIALQEADYLDASLFPEQYDVCFSDTLHSINGVVWNKERFELVEEVGDIEGRGFVVLLHDLESGQRVAVASGHLTGSNPFRVVEESGTFDSAKGDGQLVKIMETLEPLEADIKIIAMDSNVTATHPRLSLLKEGGYTLDYLNYLEPTCTNPWQVLDTKIDWIAIKSLDFPATIHNVPVNGVGLNSPQTNISDHKPIAARITY